jgi:hypothetical protein
MELHALVESDYGDGHLVVKATGASRLGIVASKLAIILPVTDRIAPAAVTQPE